MDLKERVAQMIQEELGDCIEGIRFTGSYEGEEFNVIITLHGEPDDFEKRNTCLRLRLRKLGYDVGLFVEFPEETITV